MCCKYETFYENTQVGIRIIDKYTTNRPPFMEVNELLNTLILHFANGNQSRFARILGLSPSTVATWIARKIYAPERIKRAFPQVDGNWLLTGEGNMLLPDSGNTKAVLATNQNTNHGTQIIGENVENRNCDTEMLKQRIKDLQALLDEKERLIKVLLSK